MRENKSIYPRVYRRSDDKAWVSCYINKYGRTVHCGSFLNEEDAAAVSAYSYFVCVENWFRNIIIESLKNNEHWKRIDFSDRHYYVSDYGRAMSLIGKPKILKPGNSSRDSKYKSYKLLVGGEFKHFYAHRLVAMCFIPNPNNYDQINHIDSDTSNNHMSNLEWCTPKHNINHAINKGRMLIGEKNGNSKLTVTDVASIKRFLYDNNENGIISKLAKKYNVSFATISNIKYGRIWCGVGML